MKRFSDFADETHGLEGRKERLDDVINRQIVVTGYRIAGSKHNSGQCLTLQFYYDGQPAEHLQILFTGSQVLAEQMRKYGDEIPFSTTIRKIDKYYTMS